MTFELLPYAIAGLVLSCCGVIRRARCTLSSERWSQLLTTCINMDHIHVNTSQMADLRMELEKVKKELSEEKAAHKGAAVTHSRAANAPLQLEHSKLHRCGTLSSSIEAACSTKHTDRKHLDTKESADT